MKLLPLFVTLISITVNGQNIKVEKEITNNAEINLKKNRQVIDSIDKQIINLLAARMEAAKNIGIIKKQNNIPVEQSGRWDELLKKLKKLALKKKLDTIFVQDIYDRIHVESKKLQNNISKG